MRWFCGLATFCALLCVQPNSLAWSQEQPASRGGIVPTDADGHALNLGFESGTLKDWTAKGEAFAGQPIEGDTVVRRRGDSHSGHAGSFWVGGFERAGDAPQGTLTSVPFRVTQPWASFLVAGGTSAATRVEIVAAKTDKVILKASGDESETLKPVAADLRDYLGQDIFIRLVDEHTGGWGHLNFDDFRFHEKQPVFSPRAANAADQYAHHGLSPQAAAEAMQVPAGFSVSLFAGEPDVRQPIAMAIDDRGRLWVAEAYSYPVRLPDDRAHDRILIFEDTDRDGRFDRRTVFVDNLNLVSGIELGYGGVWVGAAPYLLFIPDRNADDQPDGPPEVVLDGWAYQDTHETLNSFIWGPDGWLYGCHGVFTHSRVGQPGTPDAERQPINAGVWRYHPLRKQFEVFAHGTSNPWGVDFNERGQAFLTACVIPHLYHIIQGGRYQRQAGQHFNPYTYDDIKTIARHRHYVGGNPHGGNGMSDSAGGGHAHAGAMIYLGAAWPAPYRDQIFMNNIHGARINQDQLTVEGSGYAGDRAPDFLLANDTWSQILYLTYGPDGQVYLIDWYDNNQCHHGNEAGHDRSNGRIFKVSYRSAAAQQDDERDLRSLPDARLVELQLHANDWYVRHARRLIAERAAAGKLSSEVLPALEKIAFSHPDETRRLRGLWALHAAGADSEARLLRALDDASPYVRGWAVQLAAESGTPPASLLGRMRELAKSDPSPVVRLYLASASGRLPADAASGLAVELVAHSEDQADQNLPLLDWYAAESLVAADPARAWPLLRNARIELVHNFLIRRLAQTGSTAVLGRLIDETLAASRQPSEQVEALRQINLGLRGERRAEMPPNWPATFTRLLASDLVVRTEATTLATTFGDPQAVALHLATLNDRQKPADLRRDALAALVKVGSPELAGKLLKLLDDEALRGPVLRALAGFDDAATPAAVLAVYPALNEAERRDALATLAARPAYARQMLVAVERGQLARANVGADVIRQLRNLKDRELEEQIVKVWGTVRDTPAAKAAQIAELQAMLTAGPHPTNAPDLPLGRAVFARTCGQCHTLFGVGGKVGPDLTGSNRGNLDYVLSNIVDPSALVGKDYQAHIITTSNGRVLTGLVRESDNQSVSLQTANETLVIPRAEIDDDVLSPQSMMPEDLIKPLTERELRSLVAYLASPRQTLLRATADNAATVFNGRDLALWQGDDKLWRVENGEIVGQTAGLQRNEFLTSELLLDDFRLTVEVKLVDNRGNSGIQFRSTAIENAEVRGYQADVGVGWWGKLYEEHGRGLLWDKSGEAFVKPGDWNEYRIEGEGHHVRTWLNGNPCVDLHDPSGELAGCLALQLHAGEATEVRFKNWRLELPKK